MLRVVVGAIGSLALWAAGGCGSVAALECPFSLWQTYGNLRLYRNAPSKSYLYITSRAAIDADGAPNAYHPDDAGKPCMQATRGLDCPDNAGYPHGNWTDVLVVDPNRPKKPFVQKSGPTKGFFVAGSSLTAPGISDLTDPARYVDAATVPYLVFPKPFYRLSGSGMVGDLGVAYHLITGKSTAFVVGDVGSGSELGEASIALLKQLGGSNPDPRSGGGIAKGEVLYFLFPKSVTLRPTRWPMSNQAIEDGAMALLEPLGGRALFEACKSLN